jgi:hypothetical protein
MARLEAGQPFGEVSLAVEVLPRSGEKIGARHLVEDVPGRRIVEGGVVLVLHDLRCPHGDTIRCRVTRDKRFELFHNLIFDIAHRQNTPANLPDASNM